MREALQLLGKEEERRQAALQALREQINISWDQAELGELLDGAPVMEALMRRHQKRLDGPITS